MKGIWNIDFNGKRLKRPRTPITDIQIEAERSREGGFTRKCLAKWGVPWPPPAGWRKAILTYGVPLLPIDATSKKTLRTSTKKVWALLERAEAQPPLPEKVRKKIKKAACPPKEAREAFYKSWEWRTLRMEALKRHGARCQCCGADSGDMTMAGDKVRICVDHIKPLATHWHLRLDPSNLQILCDECNQGKGAWDETDWRVDDAIKAQLQYQI